MGVVTWLLWERWVGVALCDLHSFLYLCNDVLCAIGLSLDV